MMTEIIFPDGSGLITGVERKQIGDDYPNPTKGETYVVQKAEHHNPPKIGIYRTKIFQTITLVKGVTLNS